MIYSKIPGKRFDISNITSSRKDTKKTECTSNIEQGYFYANSSCKSNCNFQSINYNDYNVQLRINQIQYLEYINGF